MSRDLKDLDPRFRHLAQSLLEQANAIEPTRVICTLRTEAEQADAIARGVSWTTRSKHLPQPPYGLAMAIDICPKRLLVEKNWAPDDSVWQRLGAIGESLGLRWGGRWKRRDCPHFEIYGLLLSK